MRKRFIALMLLVCFGMAGYAEASRLTKGKGGISGRSGPPPSGTSSGPNTGGETPADPGCNYYAAPASANPAGLAGNAGTSTSPFRPTDFWSLGQATIRGKTLCLKNGTYVGLSYRIIPPENMLGTQAAPITVRAENDGLALVDGEFQNNFPNYPLGIKGGAWIIISGINFKNGGQAVGRIESSNNITIRRSIFWDADIRLNNSVFYNISSTNTLCEDCAFFGAGISMVQHIGNGGSLICRRCWGQWEGSVSNGSPKTVFDLGYSHTPNGWCENCWATSTNQSMPASYSITDALGNAAGGTGSDTNIPNPPQALIRYRADVPPAQDLFARCTGCVAYLLQNSVWRGTELVTAPTGGADGNFMRFDHLITFVHPSNSRFNILLPMRLQQATTAQNNVFASRISNVRGSTGAAISSTWSVTGRVDIASPANVGAAQTALNSASANPYTGSTGAQTCFRVDPGTTNMGTIPLFPWPMRDRIKAATASAGAYAGPCLNCTGGRTARVETDVQADVVSLLGTVPAQCGG